jgi:hypothetical protein
MTETKLRNFVSVFLLLSHISVPVLLFVLTYFDRFTWDELKGSLPIIVPMLAAVSGFAITHIISVKKKPDGRLKDSDLSGIFVFSSILLPAFFVILIVILVLMKGYRGWPRGDDFKMALAAVETVFGAYTGKLMGSLFEKEKTK